MNITLSMGLRVAMAGVRSTVWALPVMAAIDIPSISALRIVPTIPHDVGELKPDEVTVVARLPDCITQMSAYTERADGLRPVCIARRRDRVVALGVDA